MAGVAEAAKAAMLGLVILKQREGSSPHDIVSKSLPTLIRSGPCQASHFRSALRRQGSAQGRGKLDPCSLPYRPTLALAHTSSSSSATPIFSVAIATAPS